MKAKVPRKSIAGLGRRLAAARRVGYREVLIPLDCAIELHAYLKPISIKDWQEEVRSIVVGKGGAK